MTAVSIHIKQHELDAPRFRATLGNREKLGRTMGEALDALLADWDITVPEADVRIEPIESGLTESSPHLLNVNGVWVIAGEPPMSLEDTQRDYVSEMYLEREQSLYPTSATSRDDHESTF